MLISFKKTTMWMLWFLKGVLLVHHVIVATCGGPPHIPSDDGGSSSGSFRSIQDGVDDQPLQVSEDASYRLSSSDVIHHNFTNNFSNVSFDETTSLFSLLIPSMGLRRDQGYDDEYPWLLPAPFAFGASFGMKAESGSEPLDLSMLYFDPAGNMLWMNCSSSLYKPKSSGELVFKDVDCGSKECKDLGIHTCPVPSSGHSCSFSIGSGETLTISGTMKSVHDFFMRTKFENSVNSSSPIRPFYVGCVESVDGSVNGKKVTEEFLQKVGVGKAGFTPAITSVISQVTGVGGTNSIFNRLAYCVPSAYGTKYIRGYVVIGGYGKRSGDYETEKLIPSSNFYEVKMSEIQFGSYPNISAENAIARFDPGEFFTYVPLPLHRKLTENFMRFLDANSGLGTLVHNSAFVCINRTALGNVIYNLPSINFIFSSGMTIKILYENYLFQLDTERPDVWCLGYKNALESNTLIIGAFFLNGLFVDINLPKKGLFVEPRDCTAGIEQGY